MPERYHENFVIYDKDLCKHWKNGFFCDKIDRKSVLWIHTAQTVTGKREREKVEFMSLAVVTLKKGEGRFLKSGGLWAVSYTHLDVYKRQIHTMLTTDDDSLDELTYMHKLK